MPDMRFAPPPSVRVTSKSGGMNQISVRSFNERLVLSLLRQHGALSRQDLGQKSGLSAQTISVIVRALESDGLILQGEKKRGRVGPPTIPMSLNPAGAFALGIELGHKEARATVVDFTGGFQTVVPITAPPGTPELLANNLADAITVLVDGLDADARARLVGFGISMPSGAKEEKPSLGDRVEDTLTKIFDLPVIIQNDVTCAASAEVSFGEGRQLEDFMYFFVDSEVGCRLILGNHIYSGKLPSPGSGKTSLGLAGLWQTMQLEQAPGEYWPHGFDWTGKEIAFKTWSNAGAKSMAEAIQSALGFVDISTVVIDGRLPEELVALLLEELRVDLETGPAKDIKLFSGGVGASAKAIGAANLVLSDKYLLQDVQLTDGR